MFFAGFIIPGAGQIEAISENGAEWLFGSLPDFLTYHLFRWVGDLPG